MPRALTSGQKVKEKALLWSLVFWWWWLFAVVFYFYRYYLYPIHFGRMELDFTAERQDIVKNQPITNSLARNSACQRLKY